MNDIKMIDGDGKEILDENIRKMSQRLSELTTEFTKECKKVAEGYGVELTVQVKFGGN